MQTLTVKQYMTLQPITFMPEMSLTVALARIMKTSNLGGPVVDSSGKVIGFLSEQDLLDKLVNVSYFCQESDVVSDCMRHDVQSVTPEMSIIELAGMMGVGKPKIYPVVQGDKLVGIITRRNVLQALEQNIKLCFKP
jgi:predicted transcriptional regulator